MPETTATTSNRDGSTGTHDAHVVTRSALLRALGLALLLVVVVGAAFGVLLFGGSNLLPAEAMPYYVVGLGTAAFGAMLTVFLHGRFVATPTPAAGSDPKNASVLVTGRLQSLLASAFGVKLLLLVIGVLVLKQFQLFETPAKFSQVATFAVSFAGASLLCQIATAGMLARSLRRPAHT